MHFDHLKLCAPGTRFLTAVDDDCATENPQTPTPATPDVFGKDMQLLTTETEQLQPPAPAPAPRRYPLRDRQPPEWFSPVVTH